MADPKAPADLKPEGTRAALQWAWAVFAGGILLNIDRMPVWVWVAATLCIAWRVVAAERQLRLPGAALRSVLAIALVAGVLARFHTLNGLTAGTTLLTLMGGVKLLETRTARDQFVVAGAAVFLLLAACLDRQDLLRAPLYGLHAWGCCAALAMIARAPARSPVATVLSFDHRAAIILSGRSLLFALPLALLLFVFFPRLPGAFWAIPRSDQATTGLSDSMSPGSISELTTSYDVAFRAHFDAAPPPAQERYWRGPVLHDFDGFTWKRTGASLVGLQPLQYLGSSYRYHITMEPSSQRWWFALDTTTGSPAAKVFFTYDYQLVSADPVNDATSYSLVSYTRTRAAGELADAVRIHDTRLPLSGNARSRQLAIALRRKAPSDGAYVAQVLEHFRTGGFQYTLTPPTLGRDAVDDFIFNTRLGFCGHYASAFTYLMRAAGIPARVVTGYLGGEWNPIGHYFIVRQSDAHAWSEVWLEGKGWTRIDPTAVVAPERLRRGILDILPDAVSAQARFVWSTPWLSDLLHRWDALNNWWTDRVIRFSYDEQLHLLQRLGFQSPSAAELGYVFGTGVIGWLLWVAWQVARGGSVVSRSDRLARAYLVLCRKLDRVGLRRELHQGPLDYASSISAQRPDLADRVGALLRRYTQLRYEPVAPAAFATRVREFERAVTRLTVSAHA